MKTIICCVTLATLLTVSIARPHMGKYPCRYNHDLAKSIRKFGHQAVEHGHPDLGGMLDAVADIHMHCNDAEGLAALKTIMSVKPGEDK